VGVLNCSTKSLVTNEDPQNVLWYWTVSSYFVLRYLTLQYTYRPSITGDPNTVCDVRNVLLQHPLAVPLDARIVSSCEVYTVIRKFFDANNHLDKPHLSPSSFKTLAETCSATDQWLAYWNNVLSE
jgi:hypothetical protein